MKQFKIKQSNKFLSMLLGTLGASLLRNLSAGKDTIRTVEDTIGAIADF